MLRGKKRSAYAHHRALAPPPHFDINDDVWPPTRQQEAMEKRHRVVIDIEPTGIVVYGDLAGVNKASRELFGMFKEFDKRNQKQSFQVSPRAARRIGLRAIWRRLRDETKTRIFIRQETATVTIWGPKALLPDACHCIMTFARTVDAEKQTHYVVPRSKDLRSLLTIQLPRLIAKAGGPEDEEEARQMFTISDDGHETTKGDEMIVRLWLPPDITSRLTEGLRETVGYPHKVEGNP
ncbi:hypothetical protein DL93DRAFT_1881429 [Clavulina sp. PMI_390]|nr:hypothetical protein DL93DRAFT_1881429 [Clavulina sp. PMI_390]